MNVKENEPINDQLILNWNADRKSKPVVTSILNNAGNNFKFSQESYSSDLHVYVGLDSNSGQLSITEIYAEDDTIENTQCLGIDTIGSVKEPIENIDPIYPVNADSIELETAQQWVENWMNDATRGAYLEQCFAEGNESVLLAFEVHQMDFDNGTVHTGYFGLEEGEDGKFFPHLIVLNEDLQNNTVNLEDMTRSVPPFWGTNDFGLLKRLNIQ